MFQLELNYVAEKLKNAEVIKHFDIGITIVYIVKRVCIHCYPYFCFLRLQQVLLHKVELPLKHACNSCLFRHWNGYSCKDRYECHCY
jgi:hypothetical protein